MQLEGKTVIITGAARHIGRAFAVRAGREGANVVVADKDDCGETAELVAAEGAKVLPLRVDVTDEEQTKAMAASTFVEFGRIDALVNNAGIFDGLVAKPMEEVDLDVWDAVFNVNVKGIFLCTRAVVPYMKEQGKGKIINIGSGIWLSGVTGIPHYVASKAAVMGLSRALAKELGASKINVNTLAPGGTDSGAVVDRNDVPLIPIAGRALGRVEVPEDLTGTMVFLASDDSDFITGQMITVNGGDSLY